jgi:hypothetical protein
MPVRNVSHHRGSAIGRFPSTKMKRMIAFESLLERDFVYLLDFDPLVTWFEEQPVRIEYVHEEKHLHYTPDFLLVEKQQQSVLVECKPERFVDTDENRRKFTIARKWCQERNWQFRIVTEQEIRVGYRLQNVKLLTQYARQRTDPRIRSQILTYLHNNGSSATLKEIAQSLCSIPPDSVTVHVLHMAYHHEIALPIDCLPISAEITVSIGFAPLLEVKHE